MLSDTFDEYPGNDATKPPDEAGGPSVTVHLELADVDKVWNKAIKAGAKVVMPLADMFWGDRYGLLVDPFGHRWAVATHKKNMTPAQMAKAAKKAMAKHEPPKPES